MINNHIDAFKFLLEKNADIMGRRSGNGMTPLMNAIGLKREEIRDIISEYCMNLLNNSLVLFLI